MCLSGSSTGYVCVGAHSIHISVDWGANYPPFQDSSLTLPVCMPNRIHTLYAYNRLYGLDEALDAVCHDRKNSTLIVDITLGGSVPRITPCSHLLIAELSLPISQKWYHADCVYR